jgi:lysophospholipase L1-like esterase
MPKTTDTAKAQGKRILLNVLTALLSISIAFGLAEFVVRLKNSSMKNYDIEMWRYAKELKVRSDIDVLGHEHAPSRCALLQSVDICTDEHGLRTGRGSALTRAKRRILFLGSSVTLGWGVPENETLTSRLQEMFRQDRQDVEVLNAGIGNYNAVRYVERFERRLADLHPTDIVVHYFVRDAETLDSGGGNLLLKHSELAVTAWIAATRYLWESSEKTLEQHYQEVYKPDAPGFLAMRRALRELAVYARNHDIRLYLAMTPDVHDLVNYKFSFIHSTMRAIAAEDGYVFVDLYPTMKNLSPQQLWSMPGDPHPNSLGHKLMAEAIYPVLRLPVPVSLSRQ